ncbi:MAG: hypothetical protein HC884_06130 [Chloroflexaceae bacterium]|nr:hypothetical protein [Chloroflexaceae bacterium]
MKQLLGFILVLSIALTACGGSETGTETETKTGTSASGQPEAAPMPRTCAETIPQEAFEGPVAWVPNTVPQVGSPITLCVLMRLEGQPVEGATVQAAVKYLDVAANSQATVDDLGTATTGPNGIAEIPFTTPSTTEGQIDVTVTYEGTTYDRREYPDMLEVFFYPPWS